VCIGKELMKVSEAVLGSFTYSAGKKQKDLYCISWELRYENLIREKFGMWDRKWCWYGTWILRNWSGFKYLSTTSNVKPSTVRLDFSVQLRLQDSSLYRVLKTSLRTWWLQCRKLQEMFKVCPVSLQTFIDMPNRLTRLTLTPSVIPNSNYVIMVSDWNWLKYVCVCFEL
jgi:hypothetical protein